MVIATTEFEKFTRSIGMGKPNNELTVIFMFVLIVVIFYMILFYSLCCNSVVYGQALLAE